MELVVLPARELAEEEDLAEGVVEVGVAVQAVGDAVEDMADGDGALFGNLSRESVCFRLKTIPKLSFI